MHVPVLLRETLEGLNLKAGDVVLDGTVGGGGHAEAILARVGPQGFLVGLDRDAGALARVAERLSATGGRFVLEQEDFAEMKKAVQRHGIERVNGLLLDLGMSSDQLDDASRGFSFQQDGPLDMRLDPSQGPTAAEWLAEAGEAELADALWRLGEERAARRIARMIVLERGREPLRTTGRLAELVSRAKGGRRGRIHPATQTFQALRMVVNHELESLENALADAPALLAPGGRMAVISFHSLEDRMVKRQLGRHQGTWESLPAGGRRWVGERPLCRWITRKPVTASTEEIAANPRSRSAKLRILERTE